MSAKKKWFLRITLGTIVLILLLLAAVQVVLWTSLPRNWVLAAIQEKLQLRVQAQSLDTGWSGTTTLSGVNVSLPLAQEAFLETPRLQVRHTGLLALMLGRSLKVEAITIDKPNLLVRQQPDGRWNLEEVAELIRRAGGGKTAETQSQPTPSGVPQLPIVTVTDAVIRLVDVRGRQATVAPLVIHGQPQGALVWKYDATINDQLQISGEVAPGGDWQHNAHVQLAHLEPWVAPFLGNPSPASVEMIQRFKLDAQWRGRVDRILQGRLDLKELFLAGYTATGPLSVTFNQGESATTVITPAGATITPPHKNQIPPARITSGTIALDGKSVTAKELSLAFAGGELRLGGSYAWNSGQAGLQAWWNQLVLPAGVIHSGSLTAALRQPWPNQPVIDVTLTSNGRRGSDTWDAKLILAGSGTAWDRINWKVSAPSLSYWTPKQGYVLDQLQANLSTRGDLLTLDTLSLPAGDLYGKWRRGTLWARGRYNLTSGDWNIYLAGNHWQLAPNDQTPANFSVNLYGDRTWARLQELYLEGAGMQIWADGDIAYASAGMPAELHFFGWYPPLDYTWRERGSKPTDDVKLSGRLESELHLTKGAWPLNLDIHGALYARQFRVKDHPVGDVAIKLEGHADPHHLQIGTSRLELFSGIWSLNADYLYAQRLSTMEVKLQELSLAELDNFVGPPPNLRGTVSGHWNVSLPEFDPHRMTLVGDYSAHRIGLFHPAPPTTSPAVAAALDKPQAATAPVTLPTALRNLPTTQNALVIAKPAAAPATATAPTTQPSVLPIARAITGKVSVANGVVNLDPILLELGGGQTRASVRFPIDAPRQMHVVANAAAWPLELADHQRHQTRNVLLWAQTRGIDVDLKHLTAAGPLGLHANIARNDQTVANISIDSEILGKRIDLKSIKGDGLGGTIEGDGYIYLDAPLQSAGRVDWQNIDAQSVIALAPFTQGLAGRYTGSLRFSPTDKQLEPDATGPFSISGSITSTKGNWHGMAIGDASFIAHLDDQRAILDRLKWNLAGGTLKAWTRVTWYHQDPFVHTNLEFNNLSLDQIVGAARPAGQSHKPVPGLISGTAIAAGNPFSVTRRKEASGEIHAKLTQSDLGNVAVVNLLYSLLSVKLGPPVPTGHGFVEARLEGQRLEIPVVRYFNRGVDLWASAAVVNIFEGAKSPIEGSAAGSARPLKDLKLPFMADVDQIFRALQGGIATASIQGTVGDPAPKVIPFAEAGDAFRRFMIGEVTNEVRGTAGR